MSLKHVFVLVFILLVSIAYSQEAISKPIKNRIAVVIGIDKHKDTRITPLKNGAFNAQSFSDFLINKCGYKSDNVKLLINEKATQGNIRKVISDSWLPRKICPGDLLVIYVSTRISDPKYDIAKGRYFLCHDTSLSQLFSTGIKLDGFASDVKRRAFCDRIVFIIDTDNSGVFPIESGRRSSSSFRSSPKADSGIIAVCSSDKDQSSFNSKSRQGSVFTNALIDQLHDGEINDSLKLVFEKTKTKVENEVNRDQKSAQTPVMKSNWVGEIPSLQMPIESAPQN